MSKYDLGYKRAQKGLVGILCRPNSDSWELEEEFSDEVKSGQKKKNFFETENCPYGRIQQLNATRGRVMLWKQWNILVFNKTEKKSCLENTP